MIKLKSYKCAVFDCDGVILDSNHLKTEAFRFALDGESDLHVEQFINYHRENGGVSRYVKFFYFYNEIKKVDNPKIYAETALKKYAARVKRELVSCPIIPGAIELIKHFNECQISCIVNSGSDQGELREVFRQRMIDTYFIKILGSPATKKENISSLLDASLLKYPAVFFGDARSDYEAAKEYGMDFVFISGFSEWGQGPGFCKKNGLPSSIDFLSILDDIEILNANPK